MTSMLRLGPGMPELGPRGTAAHQEAELADGKVAAVGGLPTLLAHDAHANGGLLDHGHVVGAIADGQALAGQLAAVAAVPACMGNRRLPRKARAGSGRPAPHAPRAVRLCASVALTT